MKNKTDWNALRDEAYKMACDHGFHDKERSAEEAIELIHCELAEATESLRKGEGLSLDCRRRKARRILCGTG